MHVQQNIVNVIISVIMSPAGHEARMWRMENITFWLKSMKEEAAWKNGGRWEDMLKSSAEGSL
jgi:hypothetical protein